MTNVPSAQSDQIAHFLIAYFIWTSIALPKRIQANHCILEHLAMQMLLVFNLINYSQQSAGFHPKGSPPHSEAGLMGGVFGWDENLQ